MKTGKLSGRDVFLLIVLVVLLVGVGYYMWFLTPLKAELSDVSNQCADLDMQISGSQAKVAAMDQMQAELDELRQLPASELTEIAPFDNAQTVMMELDSILSSSNEYALSFSEPSIDANGFVRRAVNLNFSAESYKEAKTIIENLSDCHWRCLIGNLSMSSDGDVLDGAVRVSAVMTFFESTEIE